MPTRSSNKLKFARTYLQRVDTNQFRAGKSAVQFARVDGPLYSPPLFILLYWDIHDNLQYKLKSNFSYTFQKMPGLNNIFHKKFKLTIINEGFYAKWNTFSGRSTFLL